MSTDASGPDDGGNYLYRLMREESEQLGIHDLGHNVRIMFSTRTVDGPRVGLIESHRSPEGRECGGQVLFDVPENKDLRPGPRWTVESWSPLTLSPSILCSCGHHGWIREGQWIPA